LHSEIINTLTRHEDSELLLQWKQGNDAAFETFYKRHIVQLLGAACKKINDEEAAKDIVQEMFLSMISNRDKLPEIDSPKAYLHTSLKHSIYNYYRRELVSKRYEEFAVTTATGTDDTLLHQLHAKELETQLVLAIETLPPQCRHVFKLSRQEFLSNSQIAEKLQISENTVEQHMRKALRLLRISLGEYLPIAIILWSIVE
jgi:RNA polymerase sigma-70 factor (family 1)